MHVLVSAVGVAGAATGPSALCWMFVEIILLSLPRSSAKAKIDYLIIVVRRLCFVVFT